MKSIYIEIPSFFRQFQGGVLGQHFLDKMLEWTRKYPTMYVMWLGLSQVRVVLNHPDSIKKILATAGTMV
jgi:hypothetical protein